MTLDDLLLTPEVASAARLTTRTLENMRVNGDGPPFVRIGRAVRYRKSDVEAWLASRVRRSTSERVSSERLVNCPLDELGETLVEPELKRLSAEQLTPASRRAAGRERSRRQPRKKPQHERELRK